MALVVQKFGGTSVGSVERIRNVARRCHRGAEGGQRRRRHRQRDERRDESPPRPRARGRRTCPTRARWTPSPRPASRSPPRSPRWPSSRGRQGALAPRSPGEDPHRRRVHQGAHQDDRGLEDLLDASKTGQIAVVAGFQGVDEHGDITTLGRGGSDTTAVAVAAAIGADACEIYTDVDGVYTTDPNICPSARKIARISYEEMLELASLGAKVLQIRSVEIAMKYGVPVHVRSSFTDAEGTWVTRRGQVARGRRRRRRRLRQERGARLTRRRRRQARRRRRALRRASPRRTSPST